MNASQSKAGLTEPLIVNYIQILNWFWEEVPYRTGYKSEYGSTFLAIIDSINRNSLGDQWRETAIDYERIINKIRCSKRMYYEALKWLQGQNILVYLPGRNEHAAARFHLSESVVVGVQKRTSSSTSNAKVTVQKRTSSDTSTNTSTSTSGAPINKNKPITYKPQTLSSFRRSMSFGTFTTKK